MLRSLWTGGKIIVGLVLIMILVHVINVVLDGQLNQYGIIPRSVAHWFHIFTSPFIHGDLGHLINNLFGLAIFSALCLFRSTSLYVACSIFVIVLTGVLIWCFARGVIHIGASGWIFGLWSFSIAIAWFDRRLINILCGFVVVFLYGGMIYGLLPNDPKISFEAHLFGAISGALFAFLHSLFLKRSNRNEQEKNRGLSDG
ncbi:rhomboid family intramembrane serine protease [Oleiphilus sp. HI0009]|uniref:rhomboid family intramembrane serine protease n=1 Tax=unclassified Oleiphilus TaxID=2631174 RepID=UPI0007C2BB2B|nr:MULTISPECIES: rhomboid family intramembrane serine protease [unclassified Oleiphilus]KZX83773.1 rhomboid family intramembrane serine protease [Oleiphilus sp. HI0009]KZY63678.1 rhomboid family intramembrane serine protease [Oleiphilus sp. HI0066]KZY67948.1 rhomboid family intramembrane serine protease [Oleiphilus sp. HI0067]KZY71694.1 rhomboid family intramembrane serine protease [Oleiphilus sp. HI0066]